MAGRAQGTGSCIKNLHGLKTSELSLRLSMDKIKTPKTEK